MTTCVAQPYAKWVTGFSTAVPGLVVQSITDLAVELLAVQLSQTAARPAWPSACAPRRSPPGRPARWRARPSSGRSRARVRCRRPPAPGPACRPSSSQHDLAEHRVNAPWPISVHSGTGSWCRRLPAAGSTLPYSVNAVADTGVLDRAGDAGVPRRPVRVPDGEQRLLDADARPRAAGRCRRRRLPSRALRQRISQPSIPTRSARRSSMPSMREIDLVRRRTRAWHRRAVVGVDGAAPRCRRPGTRRPRRRGRRRARAPCPRRWRRRRCRPRSARAPPRSRPSRIAAHRVGQRQGVPLDVEAHAVGSARASP